MTVRELIVALLEEDLHKEVMLKVSSGEELENTNKPIGIEGFDVTADTVYITFQP